MSLRVVSILSLLMVVGCQTYKPCGSKSQLLLKTDPLGFVVSVDKDNFWAKKGRTYRAGAYYLRLDSEDGQQENLDGVVSWIPSATAGIGLRGESLEVDLTAGPGWLFNQDFNAFFVRADATLRFPLGDWGAVGPHVGYFYFPSPDYDGNADIDMDGTGGYRVGADLRLSISDSLDGEVTLDYFNASFDIDADKGWQTSDDEIDMSGFAVQAGLIWRF